MAKSFSEYETKTTSRKGCPRCGSPEKDGAVTIRLLEFKDGYANRFDQRASRQISMCETCTVEVYEELVSALDTEAHGGSRKPRGRMPSPSTGRSTRQRRRRAAVR